LHYFLTSFVWKVKESLIGTHILKKIPGAIPEYKGILFLNAVQRFSGSDLGVLFSETKRKTSLKSPSISSVTKRYSPRETVVTPSGAADSLSCRPLSVPASELLFVVWSFPWSSEICTVLRQGELCPWEHPSKPRGTHRTHQLPRELQLLGSALLSPLLAQHPAPQVPPMLLPKFC